MKQAACYDGFRTGRLYSRQGNRVFVGKSLHFTFLYPFFCRYAAAAKGMETGSEMHVAAASRDAVRSAAHYLFRPLSGHYQTAMLHSQRVNYDILLPSAHTDILAFAVYDVSCGQSLRHFVQHAFYAVARCVPATV